MNTLPTLNTEPQTFDLTGEAGKRVMMAAVKRVLEKHQLEIKALADK